MALVIFICFGLLIRFSDGTFRSAVVKGQRKDVGFDLPVLYRGIVKYAEAHDGKLPPLHSPEAFKKALHPTYVRSETAFSRRGSKIPYELNAALSEAVLAEVENPQETFLVREPEGGLVSKEGENTQPVQGVLYADGTVREIVVEGSAEGSPSPDIEGEAGEESREEES
jgi:hypothetical protein